MAKSRLGHECQVELSNETGSGAKVFETLANAGVNLSGLVGYEMGPESAVIHVVAEDHDRVCSTLQGAGYKCDSAEVVLVDVENRIGAAAEVFNKLASAGIPVEHCYSTAASGQALMVLRTSDNAKALSVLS